jgi:hypothetical protein
MLATYENHGERPRLARLHRSRSCLGGSALWPSSTPSTRRAGIFVAEPLENTIERRDESGNFGGIDSGEQPSGQLLIASLPFRRGSTASLGQRDERRPPVGRVGVGSNESTGLQRVDEPGHVARGAAERFAQLPLGHRSRLVQPPDDLRARSGQAFFSEPPVHRPGKQGRQFKQSSQRLGRAAPRSPRRLVNRRPAFIQGMGEALLVGLKVAALGAVLVLLFHPARGREEVPVRQGIVEVEAARMDG